MAEVSEDAMALISVSWQALVRIEQGNKDTIPSDAIVVLLFAGLFIESNLNYIIDKMELTRELRRSFPHNPGLQDKLCWFYNKFVAREKVLTENRWNEEDKKKIRGRLRRKFPGLGRIYKFRNDLCHGFVNLRTRNIQDIYGLRNQAKNIAYELIRIAKKYNNEIQRDKSYKDVIALWDRMPGINHYSPVRHSYSSDSG